MIYVYIFRSNIDGLLRVYQPADGKQRSLLPQVEYSREVSCQRQSTAEKSIATGRLQYRSLLPQVEYSREVSCHRYSTADKSPASGLLQQRSLLSQTEYSREVF